MPIATHVLSGDFSGLVGEVSSIRATINTNSTDGGWVNDVDNVIVLGGTVLAVGADGKFTVTLPTSTGTGLQYQVTAEFTDGSRERKTWDSGWFSLTAAGDLADLANDSTLRVTQTLGDQLAARIDGYQDHGDVSGVLTIDPATGTHVLAATGSLLVTLDTAPDGRIVTLYVVSGASNVTVDGITGLTLTDGSFASFVHVRGAWVLASAGGAAGPTDTTPPSAPTGLTATGSAGELTFSFTPGTDADSTVTHRYEVYTGTSAGTSELVTANPMTVTGLTAGTYTVRLFARSAGGNSTVVTTTATVTNPPGWSAVDTLTTALIGADGNRGTTADFTTTGARTFRVVSDYGNQVSVSSGRIKAPEDNGPTRCSFTSSAPTGTIAQEMDYTVTKVSGYAPLVAPSVNQLTGNTAFRITGDTTTAGLVVESNYSNTTIVCTAGSGYTLGADGRSVLGVPNTGRLRIEPAGQIVTVYVGTSTIMTVDFTAAQYAGGPNGLAANTLTTQVAIIQNGGMIGDIAWEAYS